MCISVITVKRDERGMIIYERELNVIGFMGDQTKKIIGVKV